MDYDVEIKDVHDKEASLKNQDLDSMSLTAGNFLTQYGWYLLVVGGLIFFLIQHINKRRSRQRDNDSPPQSQQDAVHVTRNQEALEAARRKMQEELDAKAAIYREKQTQQEEVKRKQKVEMWNSMQQGKSYKETAKLSQAAEEVGSSASVLKPKTDRNPLRNADYNPLTGHGGGTCSWRPGRRGPSSGG